MHGCCRSFGWQNSHHLQFKIMLRDMILNAHALSYNVKWILTLFWHNVRSAKLVIIPSDSNNQVLYATICILLFPKNGAVNACFCTEQWLSLVCHIYTTQFMTRLTRLVYSVTVCDQIRNNPASMHTKIKLTFLPEMDCWSSTLSYFTLSFPQNWCSLVSAAAFIRLCESQSGGFGAIQWPWLCLNGV